MTEAEPIAYINGKRYVLPAGRAEWPLLKFLRGGCSRRALVLA